MSKSVTMKDVEVSIVGITFIVDYHWYQGCPATHWQPSDPMEVEVSNPRVKNQPDGDAESLLTAIKVQLYTVGADPGKIVFTNGYDLLEAEIKKIHHQC